MSFAPVVSVALLLLSADPAVAPVPERLAADSPRTTPAGTTFTAPGGWSISTRGQVVVLDPPEPDSHLAVVEVEAKDADAAVAAAWAAYRPDARRPVKLSTPRAPRDGWEERRIFDYETSPNERATVFVLAERAGASWTVAIVDASDATYEKRASQYALAIGSLRPKGYARERFTGRKAHRLDASRVAELRKFLEDGMRQLDIPGVAFSLVQDGKVVHVGGLGVKELGKPAPVDADTLFIAASNTKALATLLLAKLADEGKLGWDQPVTEIYPAFKLGDPETTRQVLVKHLVCACTGLPRQDMEWIFEYERETPESAMRLLGTMQPTSKFGEVFQYSNLMAAAAGFIGGHLADPKAELGAAFDRAMRKKLFDPLGMKTTTFDFARALRGNHATPHGDDVDGRTLPAPMGLNYSIVPVRPAGGVWTSARELTRYVQMELANGKLPDGRRLVSEKNLLERRKPQVAMGEDATYGMGLMVDTEWGVPVVHHGGDMPGYHSEMFWFPENGVGAVILTNSDAGWRLRGPFLRRIAEVLFDGRPEAAAQLAASATARKAAIAKARERLVVPAAAAEAGKLASRYGSQALGSIVVRREGGNTVFDVGEWRSEVASRRNDDGTTSFLTIAPTLDGFEFVVAEREGKRTLVLRDAQHEYVFVEAAPP
jgi:CubicO group peptidase (beta-lactamase class C family)